MPNKIAVPFESDSSKTNNINKVDTSSEYKICGVILASGLSIRMNETKNADFPNYCNKLLLELHGKHLIEYPINECLKARDTGILENVVVVTAYDDICDVANKNNIDYILNSENKKGQSSSVKLGVKHFINDNNCDAIAFFMGDMPFIKCKDIEYICNSFQNEILIPTSGDLPTNPVVFPKRYFDDLLALEGDVGGKRVMKGNRVQKIEVDYCVQDVDNWADFDRVRKEFK